MVRSCCALLRSRDSLPAVYVNASHFVVHIQTLRGRGLRAPVYVCFFLIPYMPVTPIVGFNEKLLDFNLALNRLTNDLELSPSMLAPVVPNEGIDFSRDLHPLCRGNIKGGSEGSPVVIFAHRVLSLLTAGLLRSEECDPEGESEG